MMWHSISNIKDGSQPLFASTIAINPICVDHFAIINQLINQKPFVVASTSLPKSVHHETALPTDWLFPSNRYEDVCSY